MNTLGIGLILSPLILLSGCATTADPKTDPRVMYVSNSYSNAEPYWSNHFFDTGYGYHNMGYWGVGSWDIGSFRTNRDPL